jgi:hypothetical protein
LESGWAMEEILKLVGIRSYEIFETWLYSQIEEDEEEYD